MAKLSLFEKRRRRVRTSLLAKRGLRARLSVHRSGRHIYAQVIDDEAGTTVVAASTLEKDARAPKPARQWMLQLRWARQLPNAPRKLA